MYRKSLRMVLPMSTAWVLSLFPVLLRETAAADLSTQRRISEAVLLKPQLQRTMSVGGDGKAERLHGAADAAVAAEPQTAASLHPEHRVLVQGFDTLKPAAQAKPLSAERVLREVNPHGPTETVMEVKAAPAPEASSSVRAERDGTASFAKADAPPDQPETAQPSVAPAQPEPQTATPAPQDPTPEQQPAPQQRPEPEAKPPSPQPQPAPQPEAQPAPAEPEAAPESKALSLKTVLMALGAAILLVALVMMVLAKQAQIVEFVQGTVATVSGRRGEGADRDLSERRNLTGGPQKTLLSTQRNAPAASGDDKRSGTDGSGSMTKPSLASALERAMVHHPASDESAPEGSSGAEQQKATPAKPSSRISRPPRH